MQVFLVHLWSSRNVVLCMWMVPDGTGRGLGLLWIVPDVVKPIVV